MLTILTAVVIVGWVAASVIGTQAYFRGEQSKPIHARNWRSDSFESLAKSFTGADVSSDRIPGFTADAYSSQNLPTG